MTDLADAVGFSFEGSYHDRLPELSLEWEAEVAPSPEVVVLNRELAASLGLASLADDSSRAARVLTGGELVGGSVPVSMVYSGHQFGSYNPQLGDGRALLLGEVVDSSGVRRDVQLKGSGRTPFSRGGDGKATIGPMLREYLIAEAMHALGVPTGRALAVVTTGEDVMRDDIEPGAVLTRVASSHLRVGTFEWAARLEDTSILERLTDYTIERHHPDAAEAERPALALLEAVVEVQASLVAEWMLVGFVHGVVNTDNTTISGETIDYGPCAFLDTYDPATVFSSIDHAARYAYGNQPSIIVWNLARLAESLLRLIDDEPEAAVELAMPVLESFEERYRRNWLAGMRAKLGLSGEQSEDEDLAAEFLDLLHAGRADYTNTFRALASTLRDADAPQPLDTAPFADWYDRWRTRALDGGRSASAVADAMDAVNPAVIPRNHLVQDALDRATAGDLEPFHDLLDAVTRPFDPSAPSRFHEPAPPEFAAAFQTFCGT